MRTLKLSTPHSDSSERFRHSDTRVSREVLPCMASRLATVRVSLFAISLPLRLPRIILLLARRLKVISDVSRRRIGPTFSCHARDEGEEEGLTALVSCWTVLPSTLMAMSAEEEEMSVGRPAIESMWN